MPTKFQTIILIAFVKNNWRFGCLVKQRLTNFIVVTSSFQLNRLTIIQYTQISLWVRILHLSLANYKLTCAILIQKPYGMFHSPVKGHSPSQFMDLIHTVISNSTFYETHLPRVVDKMSSPHCLPWDGKKKFR